MKDFVVTKLAVEGTAFEISCGVNLLGINNCNDSNTLLIL